MITHPSPPSTSPTASQRWWRFLGPAFLVSIGYIDPGNWATDLAAGSQLGYSLLWVLFVANLMAMLLQSLSARLGIVTGMDLAQASRQAYGPYINGVLFILAQVAIVATDLAEIIGMAIGLQLLFGLPLIWGVLLTTVDTVLFLALLSRGAKLLEGTVIAMLATIAAAFVVQLCIVKPEWHAVAQGMIATPLHGQSLYLAIGILGATIMPHNLYLHSALARSSRPTSYQEKRQAIRGNLLDTGLALNSAFLINVAILLVAAAGFYHHGLLNVQTLEQAHHLLGKLFGPLAAMLFAAALILCGQSSTLTGTLAGQVVMEGHLNITLPAWQRRLLTRLLAIVPATASLLWLGDKSLGSLLILSQVVLSLQLGFAMIPLLRLVSHKPLMRACTLGKPTLALAAIVAGLILLLNIKLVIETLSDALVAGGWQATLALWLGYPVLVLAMLFMLWLTIRPLTKSLSNHGFHDSVPEECRAA